MHLRCARLSLRARFAAAVCWCGLLALAGCSRGPSLGKIVPVQGKITKADGTPLTGTFVLFIPIDSGPNAASPYLPRGRLKEDGSFTISTRGQPGAPLGKYRVVLLPGRKRGALRGVPAQYTSQEKSPLEVEVAENKPEGAYDLKLLPRKGRR
jgi:hypothetical protein